MSEEKQRRARDRRDATRRREANARERADRNRERGDDELVRLHEMVADEQADAADRAERERVEDVAVEGDQLGRDAGAS